MLKNMLSKMIMRNEDNLACHFYIWIPHKLGKHLYSIVPLKHGTRSVSCTRAHKLKRFSKIKLGEVLASAKLDYECTAYMYNIANKWFNEYIYKYGDWDIMNLISRKVKGRFRHLELYLRMFVSRYGKSMNSEIYDLHTLLIYSVCNQLHATKCFLYVW